MSLDDELAVIAGAPFSSARMLPPAAYRSLALLERETAELFGRDWLCVGRTADLPNAGDHLTAELPVVGGFRSVMVVRGDDGEIRAFDNVCIHRGAQLLDGCGSTARITCPYHAWSYRLDGSLIGGPHMGEAVETDGVSFRPAGRGLTPLPAEIWEGFVFVNQTDDPRPLGPRLTGLTDVVGRYCMAGYIPVRDQVDVWDTNWKFLVENFMDAYHIFKVHAASFGALGDTTDQTEMYPGVEQWAHHRVVERDGPDLAHASNTVLTGDWRMTTVLTAVYPGFVVQLQPDWMWHLRISPLGTEQVRIAWQVAVAPDVLAGQPDPDAYVREVLALIDLVNSEDRPIVEGLRRSVHARPFEGAPLSHLERNVHDFDQYIATRLT